MPTADQINDLRRRILEGEEPSREELKSAIIALVGERIAAHTAENTKTPKVKSKPVDLTDLL